MPCIILLLRNLDCTLVHRTINSDLEFHLTVILWKEQNKLVVPSIAIRPLPKENSAIRVNLFYIVHAH